ncbi:MAG: thiamine-phosphate kinase [Gemmatimonadota bacterium]|uniref:thiamine-phosphate kinase n=1 Tax=Candidatus Palauibacter scopulicola TaxID=3056741 RepID=UPI002384C513|nr:thiamine-phosphate kinase [Candidatus Palauibacter scopulicola]MDE2663925.1 thiamine-phosphate kinase [Candidatus Palauibacter scopulicola]
MNFAGPALAEGPETARIRAFLDGAGACGGGTKPAVAVTLPVGDDAAAFRPPDGAQVVVSCDASVEGVHFRREWMTWETIGYRAAAAALSDLAAMAATPVGLVVAAALPPELDIEIAAALGRGVGEIARRVGAEVLGGDLVASPGPAFLDVTVLGCAVAPTTRSGARPGDELWVTGEIGAAAAALRDLERGLEPDPRARRAFDRPRPRIDEMRWLRDRVRIHAAIDLSDGVARDARHLAAASGVALEVEADRLPAAPALEGFRRAPAGERLLLAGGEDYELLLAVPAGAMQEAARAFAVAFDLPLTRIGSVREGEGLTVSGRLNPALPAGFDHFEVER